MAQIFEGPNADMAEADETAWDGFADDEVLLQRPCPGEKGNARPVPCAGGMYYDPARFCTACQGTGYAIRVEKRRG